MGTRSYIALQIEEDEYLTICPRIRLVGVNTLGE